MLLSVSMAALSCSEGAFDETDSSRFHNGLTLVISGTVSDKETGNRMEGIRIRLYAAEDVENGEGTAKAETTFTDSLGKFNISANGFSRPVTCTLIAEDPQENYDSQKQNLNISWSGTSYNSYIGYFYVNDCDFYMTKFQR